MRLLNTLIVLAVLLVSIAACDGGGESQPTAPTYPQGKPTGVTALAGDRSATVSWNPVGGAAGYYVYISYDGIGFNRYSTGIITATSFSVFNLNNGQTYYFAVSAVGTGGWESSLAYPGGSPTATPVVPAPKNPDQPDYIGEPPYPPPNLQGVAKDAACEIHWDAYPAPMVVPDFSYYRIYRHDGPGTYSVVWSVIQDTWTDLEYRDSDLENGTPYSYRVTAWADEGLESNPSNVVTLTPMDFPPEALHNIELFVNPGRILLEWDIPDETDIEYYAIERVEGIDPGTGAEIIVRFLIDKPTQTKDNPELYADGLIKVWVDLERHRVDAQDGAVIVGTKYTYHLSAIDLEGQEGVPTTITADIAVY
jgi:hypothetical protein